MIGNSELGTTCLVDPIVSELFELKATDLLEDPEEEFGRDEWSALLVELSDDSLEIALVDH